MNPVKCLPVFAVIFLFNPCESKMLSSNRSLTFKANIWHLEYQQVEYPRDCQEVFNECWYKTINADVHMIRPVQYPEPFQIYCEKNETSGGGWTVVQRRVDGFISYTRSWNDYKYGFGFLGSEFWIGNEKLAHLTNQKRYQLRIDLETTSEQSFFVIYDDFRISDEWNNYSLLSLNESSGIIRSPFTFCLTNKNPEAGSFCERSCAKPNDCLPPNIEEPDRCICVNNTLRHEQSCVPKEQCGCYCSERNLVLEEGESYSDSACTWRVSCRNNILFNETASCSDNATCHELNGFSKCICDQWFVGDGVICTLHPCYDEQKARILAEGEFYIEPNCLARISCRNNSLLNESHRCSNNATCEEHNGVSRCRCNQWFVGDGVTCSLHPCYDENKGRALTEGESYINAICSSRITCSNYTLLIESHRCSNDATCEEHHGVSRCRCNQWFEGDGITCTRHPCYDSGKGRTLTEGESYINSGCSSRISCSGNRLSRVSYRCSSNGNCQSYSGVGRCRCNQWFEGNGVTCTRHPCYDSGKGRVLREGESYINSACSSRISCSSNRIRSQSYRCSSDASCRASSGVGSCRCNEWFTGDGLSCTRNGPRDCYDLYRQNRRSDDRYTIYPVGSSSFVVYCDMSNGGWTVFQKRRSRSLSFYRSWSDYKYGFGSTGGDHWLGNDKIHKITNQPGKTYQLYIEMTNSGGSYYARYSRFSIGNEGNRYELYLRGHSGAYDAMGLSSGEEFSTYDRDYDPSSSFDCAEKHRGGWWYPDDRRVSSDCYTFGNSEATSRYEYSRCEWCCDNWCAFGGCDHHRQGCKCCRTKTRVYETNYYTCGYSNLNGDYSYSDYRGIFWKNLAGSDCGITATTMKIRPS